MNPRRRRAADKEGERDGGGPKGNTRILGNFSKEAFLTCSKLSVSLSASMSPGGPARKTHTHTNTGAENSAGHRAGHSVEYEYCPTECSVLNKQCVVLRRTVLVLSRVLRPITVLYGAVLHCRAVAAKQINVGSGGVEMALHAQAVKWDPGANECKRASGVGAQRRDERLVAHLGGHL